MDFLTYLESAGSALAIITEPMRLLLLVTGVLIGLVLGILPGIGGIVGLALLLPFTYSMDPYAAIAIMLGLAAVTATSDTIPSVLFGIPGSAGSQATVLDGYPLTKKGEAGRALAAAYVASLIGGLFGALLLGISIPLLRPVILYLGSPELLAFAIFGLSLVATLSGNAPLKGLLAACIGIMLAMIGIDSQTGQQRWTLNSFYLWEGLPLVPMVLGVFAIPELCDLAVNKSAIVSKSKFSTHTGMIKGAKDALKNWGLILRCGALGSAVGAIPGLGSAVVDWFAYGYALNTLKDAKKTFGQGDIRGVIAPESANNAKESGALLPTIAFGVPGSASMALLLGAFMIQGIVPGPSMLTENIVLTYSMVWSIAIANIVGAGLCFAFSGQFAKIATLRYTLIVPAVLIIMYIGAFQANRAWGDVYTLLIFGVIGWTMKQMKWPRPPLVLGFVLGSIVEQYLYISVRRYGIDWIGRPVVAVAFGLTALILIRALLQVVRAEGGFRNMATSFGTPVLRFSDLFYLALAIIIGYALYETTLWRPQARIGALIIGLTAVTILIVSFLVKLLRSNRRLAAGQPEVTVNEHSSMHMDTTSSFEGLSLTTQCLRSLVFLGWILAFVISMAVIGLIPTIPLFVITYMRLERSEPYKLAIPYAMVLTLFVYVLFDQVMTLPWPHTVIGDFWPVLKMIPSV